MGVYHADAIVIRSREFGESDRLLTLFSREHGKIQAVAKGVRKPKSRQRAGAQLFTYAEYLLHQGKSLSTVNQASPKESFAYLWHDLERSMAATAIIELLDQTTLVGQPHPELFTLTYSSFFLLEHCEPALVQCAYALKLLANLGYRPRLAECAECGAKVGGDRLFFSTEAGGILCGDCLEAKAYGRWLSAGSLALMRLLLDGEMIKLDRIRWNEWMKQEIMKAVQLYAEQTFDKPLKSWSMGQDLLHPGQGLAKPEPDKSQ